MRRLPPRRLDRILPSLTITSDLSGGRFSGLSVERERVEACRSRSAGRNQHAASFAFAGSWNLLLRPSRPGRRRSTHSLRQNFRFVDTPTAGSWPRSPREPLAPRGGTSLRKADAGVPCPGFAAEIAKPINTRFSTGVGDQQHESLQRWTAQGSPVLERRARASLPHLSGPGAWRKATKRPVPLEGRLGPWRPGEVSPPNRACAASSSVDPV